eukprot:gene2700-3000_t
MRVQHAAKWGCTLALFTLWTSATFARKLNTPFAIPATNSTPANATGLYSVTAGLPKLIPLQLLLGNSKYRNPQLSPNGKYLAYVKPSAEGVMNVFIKQLPSATSSLKLRKDVSLFDQEGMAADKQVTFDRRRGISSYSWSDGGDAILYIQDKDGDENDHLYLVPIGTSLFSSNSSRVPAAEDLTPFPGVKASDIVGDKRFPNTLYISLNKRDPELFDLYNWLMDYDFNVREVGHRNLSDGQWIAASSSGSNVSGWRQLVNWPYGEDTGVLRFNKQGTGLYVVDSTGRDTTEFQLISTAKGANARVLQRIASNPLVNVNSVVFDPDTWEPQLLSYSYHKTQWQVLDSAIKAEWAKLEAFQPNAVTLLADRTDDQQTWLVVYSYDNKTAAYYLYQRGQWPPQLLFELQPELNKYTLAPMRSVVITARDGLKLPAYLTLPVKPGIPHQLPESVTGKIPDLKSYTGVSTMIDSASGGGLNNLTAVSSTEDDDAASNNVESKNDVTKLNLNLPMVLYVHGGPWARDSWGTDAVVQWLANRGYAVLQVNYRGSTGYGKRFLIAGDKQWGTGAMQHDLTDAVKWAISTGIADPRKVCIMGASYGGYATLAGLTFTPELYACGVDIVGISEISTFMKSVPAYWRPLHYELLNRVGNAVKNSTFNKAISPYYHVDKVRAPLIIGQGANDVRVPQKQSDKMHQAMKAQGMDVTYVLYSDEGHGLVRPENRLDFYARVDQFLAEHLGGRSEPYQRPAGTTAKVISD